MKHFKPFIFVLLSGILLLFCFPSCVKENTKEEEVRYLNVNPEDLPSLYELAYNGETKLIKKLMKDDSGLMVDPQKQRDCLVGAIHGGKMELIKYLLAKTDGIDLNSEGSSGYTQYWSPIFHYALDTGNKDMINLMVKYGADIHGDTTNLYRTTPLAMAVRSGDLASVRFLLKKGVDVNAGYWPPLHEAVEKGDKDMIRLLLKHGADINLRIVAINRNYNYDGNTCLCLAIENEDPELVRFLLDEGADVNKPGQGEWTPLQLAVDYRQTEMMKLFVEYGADVNAETKHHKYGTLTPLWLAVCNGDTASFNFLLEHGAVIQENSSLLLAATLSGNQELFDFFLDKVPEPTDWENIWVQALDEKNEYVVRYIMENYPMDVNKRIGEFNFLPLEIVARNRYCEINKRILCYLLKKGADPTLVGTNDQYVDDTMDWMMKNSSPEIFDYFLELGFSFKEWTDPNYFFARFAHALDYHYFDAARHLLKQAGDKPSVYINHYYPPILHYAHMTYEDPFPILEFLVKEKVDTAFYPDAFLRCVRYNDMESVILFLQNGVDVNVKNNEGQNALWYVCDPEMAEYLIGHGIDVSVPLVHERELIDMNVLSVFVKHGISIKLTDEHLDEALRIAARLGNEKMVEYFLSRGADINGIGEKTPLMENASKGYETCSSDPSKKISPRVVKQLLKAGADVDAEDKEGNTALMYALGEYTCKDHKCRSRYEWDRQMFHGGLRFPDQDRSLIVRELLKAGADVNKENQKGDTPLTLAVRYEHTDLIPLLKKYGAVK